jgi:hypothetical protein
MTDSIPPVPADGADSQDGSVKWDELQKAAKVAAESQAEEKYKLTFAQFKPIFDENSHEIVRLEEWASARAADEFPPESHTNQQLEELITALRAEKERLDVEIAHLKRDIGYLQPAPSARSSLSASSRSVKSNRRI